MENATYERIRTEQRVGVQKMQNGQPVAALVYHPANNKVMFHYPLEDDGARIRPCSAVGGRECRMSRQVMRKLIWCWHSQLSKINLKF